MLARLRGKVQLLRVARLANCEFKLTVMENIQPILDRALAGERLTADDCARLLASHDIARIGVAADEVRQRWHNLSACGGRLETGDRRPETGENEGAPPCELLPLGGPAGMFIPQRPQKRALG